MISGDNSFYPNGSQIYNVPKDMVVSSSLEATSGSDTPSSSLLYSLSVFKDKVHLLESLATIFISPNQAQNSDSTALAIANMGTLVQEIIVNASSMMFTCQQMALGATLGHNQELHHPNKALSQPSCSDNHTLQVEDQERRQGFYSKAVSQPSCSDNHALHVEDQERRQGLYSNDTLDWYSDNNNNWGVTVTSKDNKIARAEPSFRALSPKGYDIIELDAADLLAKYTHYCQVCGKGFKRDANLRMHMRAHGDEYKSSAALINPLKNNNGGNVLENMDVSLNLPRKYSCPQEGCRWNRKHAKFQPLKSMICVKNHYKRSHCPKMYVCKRCNRKEFSVLSDLRTHEKHCGDLKWQCSCGTTFSRKDKLMGHVALFVGHSPAGNLNCLTKIGKAEQHPIQMQVDDRYIKVNQIV